MAEEPIRIELQAAGGTQQSRDEAPPQTIQITNVTSRPIWMVGVLPGSEGLRYPQYRVEIEGPSGPVRLYLPEGLDYARALQREDFVRLKPGESFDPQGQHFIPIQSLAWFKPSQPGRYRLRLLFDATSDSPRDWLGHTVVRQRGLIEKLIRQGPHEKVWSNVLEIDFE